ncbi:S8 family serine peptidase [Actinoplanes sp. TBRC 11911]|uniref:S8 family serine peptidase n=1 Tax=Actinoplanes sp. TBRC 11911 TaxID=2729386 RepID=UPI00145E914F|nr:S8 family serine peptidase [Actinoplanes sp. TBRC 11911]NMO49954.1 S8 family serine peptidase [Actinoplanes sp. TBRC 11911]
MRHRSSAALALALLVAAGGVLGIPAGGAAFAAPATATPADVQSLTLITGDRITVDGDRTLVQPRKGIQFFQFRDGKHRYVVPSDAAPLLRADRLDQRLFDVSTLLDDDVEKRADLPLVMADANVVAGLSATRTLSAIDGFATKIPVRDLAARWPSLKTSLKQGKLWLDAMRTPTLDVSVPRTGAPEAWARGLDGTGITVAVLDSGVDDTHPDLAGKVVARKNFVADYEDARDVAGHGTHVASTIAGTGAASGGRYRGVAPGAHLLDGKVCALIGCPESAILDGMRWAAESGVKVVNMSFGSTDTPGTDPIEAAVNELSAQYDMLFVVAAGNDYGAQTVNSPGSADAALTVGAVDKDGAPADYSSKGPRLGDYAVKPEMTAPGTDITAARSSYLDDGTTGDPYVTFSGTSMATPHVAGAAAIMTQAHPDWTSEQRKGALIGSARPDARATLEEQGAGELTIPGALDEPITAAPATIGFGFRKYPQAADDRVTRTLTYRNVSKDPVTLKLTVDTASVFALNTDTVTVPGNGTATVEVTAHATEVGLSSGRIVATGPAGAVQTPVSIFREQPSADLSLTTRDRTPGSPGTAVTFVENVATGQQFVSYEPATTMRVPFGKYFAATLVFETDGTSTLMVNAETTVTGPKHLDMDGRKARPTGITVPDRAAQPVAAFAQAFLTGDHQIDATLQGDRPGQLFTADLGSTRVANLTAQFNASFARPDNSAAYTAGWYQNGHFATGYTKHVGARDLTAVRTEYAANTPGASGQRSNFPAIPRIPYAYGTALPSTTLPAVRTEYYAGDTLWNAEFAEYDATGQSLTTLDEPAARHHDRVERWNGAAFAYPLTPGLPEFPTIARRQDELLVRLTNYSDAAGHLGFSNAETNQHMTLSRNGQVVDQRDSSLVGFDVAPGKARLRVDYSSTQPASRLSTRIDQSWEFTSNTTVAETAVPLTAVGFAPELDLTNTARAGRLTAIALPVTSQGKAAKLRDVDVDVSFDDGTTWHRTPVVSRHGEWVTSVLNPPHPGFVSLRATATDAAGNRTTARILRAYATK